MPNVVAIDTSAGACSVAVIGAGARIARTVATERGHAELLIGLIAAAMADSGQGFADLDLIAVTTGPGSFTGLRVGLASARGLALAASLPCLGITTLDALAQSAPWPADEGVRLASIDTRRGDLYVQAFAGPERPLIAPMVTTAAALAGLVAAARLAVIGDGAETAAAALRAAGRIVTVLAVHHPAPLALADLAARRWQAGQRPRGMPEPVYLQAPLVGPNFKTAP